MTAYLPLLGRLIEQTILKHQAGQLKGILSIASRNVRSPSDLMALIDSSVVVYHLRALSPKAPTDIATGDTVEVAQTASKLVAVGDVLKIVQISSSPYKVVTEKTGWTAVLISNTVRYMT
jgi:hypothetical protein